VIKENVIGCHLGYMDRFQPGTFSLIANVFFTDFAFIVVPEKLPGQKGVTKKMTKKRDMNFFGIFSIFLQ